MLVTSITTPWKVCTPTLFRYMPAQYVDEFFAVGSLRLSSFEQFKKHEDEPRLDESEGKLSFAVEVQSPRDELMHVRVESGQNAYVLCTTMRHDLDLMERFGSDSYIRINDPTGFAVCVARHVAGLVEGYEGPCLYQANRIVLQSLKHFDFDQLQTPGNPTALDMERFNRFVQGELKHIAYFLKDKSYAYQVEYRLLWITSQPVERFLDVKVPEAIRFCSKQRAITE